MDGSELDEANFVELNRRGNGLLTQVALSIFFVRLPIAYVNRLEKCDEHAG